MSRRANFMKIGIFVLAATAVLIGALILFGLREVFKPGVMIETCFNQSVQGLTAGSDVKFRGVKIGTVKTISLVSAAYPGEAPPEFRRWVLVRAKVDSEFFQANNITDVEQVLKEEIDGGMRAYLSPQGITGLVFLEFDYEADKAEAVAEAEGVGTDQMLMTPAWEVKPDHHYIPGAPGFIKGLMDNTQSIAKSVEHFMNEDFPRISEETLNAIREANQTMAAVRGHLASPELARVPARIDKLLANLDQLTGQEQKDSLNRLMKDAEEITSGTLALVRDEKLRASFGEMHQLLLDTRGVAETLNRELPETSGTMRSTLQRLDLMIASQQQGLSDITVELRQVLRNLEKLTSTLKDNPSLILFSSDPLPVEPSK